MRFIIGVILALCFIVGGLVPIAGGFSMMSRGVTGDDILAAFFIDGMLELIGLIMLWAVIKSRKKKTDIDTGALTGTLTGIMIGSEAGDYGDDFSD